MYHAEAGQEAFLVLRGECLLIVEGEERPLQAWDFFHCPPWTEHVIVGAGDGPSLVLAVGAREEAGALPGRTRRRSEHDAGARRRTVAAEAYAGTRRSRRGRRPSTSAARRASAA